MPKEEENSYGAPDHKRSTALLREWTSWSNLETRGRCHHSRATLTCRSRRRQYRHNNMCMGCRACCRIEQDGAVGAEVLNVVSFKASQTRDMFLRRVAHSNCCPSSPEATDGTPGTEHCTRSRIGATNAVCTATDYVCKLAIEDANAWYHWQPSCLAASCRPREQAKADQHESTTASPHQCHELSTRETHRPSAVTQHLCFLRVVALAIRP